MIKSYELFNESIKDYLKPRNNLSILDKMIESGLSDDDILEKSLLNNYLYGVKYVLDKNINIIKKLTIKDLITVVNDNDIIEYLLSKKEIVDYIGYENTYILEKCKLGLHKNIIKIYEQNIIDIINSLSKIGIRDTYFYYRKDNNELFFIYSKISSFVTITEKQIDNICRKNILLTNEYTRLLIIYHINNILHLNIDNSLSEEELDNLINNQN